MEQIQEVMAKGSFSMDEILDHLKIPPHQRHELTCRAIENYVAADGRFRPMAWVTKHPN